MNGISAHPRLLGLLCGTGAAGLGLVYLLAAGAPSTYLLVNLAALVLGATLWLALGAAASPGMAGAGPVILVLAAALLATGLFGIPVDGAARWVSAGPLTLQISLIVLPTMLVLYARKPDRIGTAGMVVAAVALAVQPDRAMAGVLAAGLLGVLVARPGRLALLATLAAVVAFGWALVMPDNLPAVPYVDRIFYTAFDVHPLAGLAVVAGALLLVLPGLIAARGAKADRPAVLAFAGCWLGVVAAAALGDYPTPVVGYGGSAVLGYLLSVALLPGGIRRGAGAGLAPAPVKEAGAAAGISELRLASPA
jgi:hypothetical protein